MVAFHDFVKTLLDARWTLFVFKFKQGGSQKCLREGNIKWKAISNRDVLKRISFLKQQVFSSSHRRLFGFHSDDACSRSRGSGGKLKYDSLSCSERAEQLGHVLVCRTNVRFDLRSSNFTSFHMTPKCRHCCCERLFKRNCGATVSHVWEIFGFEWTFFSKNLGG